MAIGNACFFLKCRMSFITHFFFVFIREELKEQLEKKKKGSRALADFEDKMNNVCLGFYR